MERYRTRVTQLLNERENDATRVRKTNPVVFLRKWFKEMGKRERRLPVETVMKREKGSCEQ